VDASFAPEPGLLSDATLAETGDRLALSAGNAIALVEKSSGIVTFSEPIGPRLSPPVTDANGIIRSLASTGSYDFDSSGNLLHTSAIGGPPDGMRIDPPTPVLEPDHGYYYVDPTRNVCGRSWCTPLDVSSAGATQVVGGAGDMIFVMVGFEGLSAFSASTGQRLGSFRGADGDIEQAFIGYDWALGWDFQIQIGAIDSFDVCRQPRWSSRREALYVDASSIITLGERLVSTKWDVDDQGKRISADRMYLYAADGTVVLGPVAGQGEPYLAGADGALYTINCVYADPPANQLIAYSADLQELWRVDLGRPGNCPVGNGVLDEDGVLYLLRTLGSAASAFEVIAIQTQSPGLAESSWPSIRHDNRASAWLTSLPPLAGPTHDLDGSVDVGPSEVPNAAATAE
jgi:hypothetical protein